jgi:hypothetical protein
MIRRVVFASCCAVALVSSALTSTGRARSEEWKAGSETFRGDPIEAFGPLALFRTGYSTGRSLPFRALTDQDCARFFEKTRSAPAPSDWPHATGAVAKELVGSVYVVKDKKLVPPNFAGLPEPQLFVILYLGNNVGTSWNILWQCKEEYKKLHAAHPSGVEAVFYGVHSSRQDHVNMARDQEMPWLVTDFMDQSSMSTLHPWASHGQCQIMILSRQGVPLYGVADPDAAGVTKAFAEAEKFVQLLNPENPQTWPDRAHYLRVTQPLAFANGETGPVLVGNPLKADALRKAGVSLIDAKITVSAEGLVKSVEIRADAGVPAKLIAPLSEVLKANLRFVAAVKNGKFVDGVYSYRFDTSH